MDLLAVAIAVVAIIVIAYFFSPAADPPGVAPQPQPSRTGTDNASSRSRKASHKKLPPELQQFQDAHNVDPSLDTITVAVDPQSASAISKINEIEALVANLSQICKVVILCPAAADADQDSAIQWLGRVVPSQVPRHRLLFFQLAIGKSSQIRQLNPVVHIDIDANICNTLASHIRGVYCLVPSSTAAVNLDGRVRALTSLLDLLPATASSQVHNSSGQS